MRRRRRHVGRTVITISILGVFCLGCAGSTQPEVDAARADSETTSTTVADVDDSEIRIGAKHSHDELLEIASTISLELGASEQLHAEYFSSRIDIEANEIHVYLLTANGYDDDEEAAVATELAKTASGAADGVIVVEVIATPEDLVALLGPFDATAVDPATADAVREDISGRSMWRVLGSFTSTDEDHLAPFEVLAGPEQLAQLREQELWKQTNDLTYDPAEEVVFLLTIEGPFTPKVSLLSTTESSVEVSDFQGIPSIGWVHPSYSTTLVAIDWGDETPNCLIDIKLTGPAQNRLSGTVALPDSYPCEKVSAGSE